MPNIIQIQDDLKNLPDQVLVNYVQNPTGTMQGIAGYAPSYLVLAELQRRADMRNRYSAQQEPEKTVSDKIVEEASPTTMAQNLMGGVRPLPAGDVGKNYGEGITTETYPMPQQTPVKPFAGGGIVAFQDGGLSLDPLSKEYDYRNTGINYDPLAGATAMVEEQVVEDAPIVISGGNPYYPYSIDAGKVPYMPKSPTIQEYKAEEELAQKEFGVTPTREFYETERETLRDEIDSYQKDRKDIMNMGLLKAGLRVMAGTSQYGLTNFGEGAAPVVSEVAAELQGNKKEQRLLKKEARAINRLERAEKLGDVKGFKEKQKEVRAIQLDLMKNYADNIAKAAAAKSTSEKGLINDAFQRAADIMKAEYGEDVLVRRFVDNPEGWQEEYMALAQKILSDMREGKISQTTVQPLGLEENGKTAEDIVTIPGKGKFKKLPNGNYVPV